MSTGKWLRAQRLHIRKTLRVLAEELGLSHVFLSELERDARPVPLARLKAFAEVYGLPEGELRDRVERDERGRAEARIARRLRGAA